MKLKLSIGVCAAICIVGAVLWMTLVGAVASEPDDYVLISIKAPLPKTGTHFVTPVCISREEARLALEVQSYKEASFRVRRPLSNAIVKDPYKVTSHMSQHERLIMTRRCADILLGLYNAEKELSAEKAGTNFEPIKPKFLVARQDVERLIAKQ